MRYRKTSLVFLATLALVAERGSAEDAPVVPTKEQVQKANEEFRKIDAYVMQYQYFPGTRNTTVFDISRAVVANGNKITDDLVKKIPEVPFPHGLLIYSDKFTGEGMGLFKGRKNFIEFDSPISALNDESMKELVKIESLESLDLWAARKLTNEGLKTIVGLKNLKSLNVGGSAITGDGLAVLADKVQLEHLGISHLKLKDEHLNALKRLVNLKTVGLAENRDLTLAALAVLRDCKNLEQLDLSHLNNTNETLKEVSRYKKLKILKVFGGSAITDEGIDHIAGLTEMERLDLVYAKFTNAGFKKLRGMKDLTHLSFGLSRVTDEVVDDLIQFQKLQHVWLNSGWSKEAKAKLEKALPRCQIQD